MYIVHIYQIYTSWIQFHISVRIREDVRKQRTFPTHLFADHLRLDTASPLVDVDTRHTALNSTTPHNTDLFKDPLYGSLLPFVFQLFGHLSRGHFSYPPTRLQVPDTWHVTPGSVLPAGRVLMDNVRDNGALQWWTMRITECSVDIVSTWAVGFSNFDIDLHTIQENLPSSYGWNCLLWAETFYWAIRVGLTN